MGAAGSVLEPYEEHHVSTSHQIAHAVGTSVSFVVQRVISAATVNPTLESADVLIAMKSLGLCKLCYCTLRDSPNAEAEKQQWIDALGIDHYKCWYQSSIPHESDSETSKHFDTKIGGIEAITGIMHNISEFSPGPQPFVCFRGNLTANSTPTQKDLDEIICRDACTISSSMPSFKIRSSIYLSKYRNFNQFCVPEIDVQSGSQKGLFDLCAERASAHANGILICGHSLGGAMASIFAAEMYSNYKDSFPLHLATFGAPKIFDVGSALHVNSFPYKHLRFCNSADLVVSLGPPEHEHTGTQYVPSGVVVNANASLSSKSLDPTEGFNTNTNTNTNTNSNNPSTATTGAAGGLLQWLKHSSSFHVSPHGSIEDVSARHSISGKGGYVDSFMRTSTYTAALDKMLDGSVRESFVLLNDLFKQHQLQSTESTVAE